MPSLSSLQAVFLILTYLIGAIPFGVIISRLISGQDVRNQGSGNIGATNVARMMGKKWGVMVLIFDALKGFVVVGLAKHIGPLWYCNLVAVIAVLGHCYPIYLKFRGGKGVATALGVIAALSWSLVGLSVLVFALVVAVSRRISMGSLAAAFSVPVFSTLYGFDLLIAYAWILAILVWWKHRENIKRIATGSEPKFF
jgi:glycerol-3-phosphate acyltransferase PlsY